MKKTCKSFGSDGKGDGRASKREAIEAALEGYLSGKDKDAFNFAYGLCRDAGEAQELVQEACYRVLRESRRYDPVRPVKSWLFTILRNAFMDSRRRVERRSGVSLDWQSDDGDSALLEVLSGPDEPVLVRMEREETSALVRTALGRMKKPERRVLALCDEQGLGYDDAAKVLRVPTGTVRSRLSRARSKLRRLVARLELR